MLSIQELYRIGHGPSSSHTIAPRNAAEIFRQRHPTAAKYRVTLFGSMAATGKGHMTDVALEEAFSPTSVDIIWKPEEQLPLHPNGMEFTAVIENDEESDSWQVYSPGGGALKYDDAPEATPVYDLTTFDAILNRCEQTGQRLWEYVEMSEGPHIWEKLAAIWTVMCSSIERGLQVDGVLPGGLGIWRKALSHHRKASLGGAQVKHSGLLSAYALAVAEENAIGGLIVTAPTCGSSGALPAVIYYLEKTVGCSHIEILHTLGIAGLIGNLIKHNASISGAMVGCQGEIGAASAMAAGAATYLLGGAPSQIEYAATMGLENNLGLTCDPVAGLVQIPCIGRNAFAANQAITCANYAMFSDGEHRISFDNVLAVMLETGQNLLPRYRETSTGGLAAIYNRKQENQTLST
jgi:L-serine dehydratase